MNSELTRILLDIKTGNTQVAQGSLVSYLKKSPEDIEGWSCLYSCISDIEQKKFCAERILKLEPDNRHAKLELRSIMLGKKNDFKDFPIVNNFIVGSSSKLIKSSLLQASEKDHKLSSDRDNKSSNNLKVIETISEIQIKYRPPTIIKNIPGDNLFANTKSSPTDFIETESGMYGNRLFIGGLSISPHDFPKCVEVGHSLPKSQCYRCDFFAVSDCPIRYDPDILITVTGVYSQFRRYRKRNKDRRDAALDAIYEELKVHGRPLHYETVYKIIADRHPHLRLTPLKIARLMSWNKDKFEWVDRGVYRAK